MKNTALYLLLPALLIASCGPNAARNRLNTATTNNTTTAQVTQQEPAHYTYIVRNTYPHSVESYTQGLQYIDGTLWEGTGQYGKSLLQTIDLATGRCDVKLQLPATEFGEGITVLGDRIYQLTWTNNVVHIYDRHTLDKIREYTYTGEGWGLTSDGTLLYMSDGTETLRVIDPATFRQEKSIPVTYEGQPVRLLNELEWIEGRIWANVYTTDQIVIINPESGRVEGVVDLTGLLPQEERTPQTDVLNGIAYDEATGRIFVTGKHWPKLYEIEIVKQ